MNDHPTNQEVLLFTGTSFAKRELCEWNDTSYLQPIRSLADQLEDACWSGMLFEMFPYMFQWDDRRNICIWKVNQAEQFIRIDLGEGHAISAREKSIDPYYFLVSDIYQN